MNDKTFAGLYLKVREKEKRIYSDEEVSMLPFVKRNHFYYREWEIRKHSFKKLRTYLQKRNKPFRILDLGCGNGWMSSSLSEINNSKVIGIDRNDFEIEQAKRVFKENEDVNFFCEDILQTDIFNPEYFDIIVMAASIQYFADIRVLTERLLQLLKKNGEIHILDTQFYSESTLGKSKQSSADYYSTLGYPEMAGYYHHHLWSDIQKYNPEIRNRSRIQKLFLKIFKTKKNFFPWIIIRKG
jgi:ubiquinone/menaquinone biosynthesis C-methylase UbiE